MSGPLIWVIEDNDQNFELVDFLLGEAGYAVRRARDADDLAPLLEGPAPALVLLDMNLPSGSGLEVLAQLRADERSREGPRRRADRPRHARRPRALSRARVATATSPSRSSRSLFLATVAGYLRGGVER